MTLERVSAINFELDIVDIWDSSDLLSCTVTASHARLAIEKIDHPGAWTASSMKVCTCVN
jgi:hypothetical protein